MHQFSMIFPSSQRHQSQSRMNTRLPVGLKAKEWFDMDARDHWPAA
jgi:hypothetical protein